MPSAKPINIAGTVLRDQDGRYLLVKEKRPDIYGLWNIPAGHQDKGETLQQAAIRETYEEVGLRVELLADEPVYEGPAAAEGHIFHAFPAKVAGGSLQIPKHEILEAAWLPYSAIIELNKQGKIRHRSTMSAIRKVEDENSRH